MNRPRNATWMKGLKGIATVFALVGLGAGSWAQTDESDDGIEELVVTAQRINEDIQDVPIAVTALTGEMLEDEQVITPSDLQMNAPGVSFTATNFGGSSFAIRGIGSLGIGSGGPGVSVHTNEIAIPTNLNTIEFFDIQRVEVLRGPQGTLFGRNATGGAINFITNKPDTAGFSSTLDLEQGSYSHTRIKGMINVPLSDTIGFRLAGFKLQRDGYTENLAYGQENDAGETLPMIEEHLDDRNILALRATVSYDISEDTSLWVMGSLFQENDSRARITNQICDRNLLPTTGCEPDKVGQESVHLGSTTAGIFAGILGMLPLGASGAGTDMFEYPRPRMNNLRQIHTDFQPEYYQSEDVIAFGLSHSFGDIEFNLIGGHRTNEYRSLQDYTMDVGPDLLPNPANPGANYPVSAAAGRTHLEDWTTDGCSLERGTAGAFGGCTLEGYDTTRYFSYDSSGALNENNLIEARIHSTSDGPFNYTLGISGFADESATFYYVFSNGLDAVTTYGLPALGLPPLYPGFFLNSTAPAGIQNEGVSIFGEAYADMSDRLKFTAGLRVNNDKLSRKDNSTLFNALNHGGVIVGVHAALLAQTRAALAPLGIPPEAVTLGQAVEIAVGRGLLHPDYLDNINVYSGAFWSRTLNLLLGPFAGTGAPETALAMHYGATSAQIQAALATPAYSPERVAISKMVPIVPGFNETRMLTGSPDSADFNEFSGRIGLDWQGDNDTLWYGFLSKGYKPGGLNPAIPPQFQASTEFTFEPESVNALEVGRKSRGADGRLLWNSALYYYDYTGLQASVIRNNSSVTENIDATIIGLETEGSYRFDALPTLSVDFSYGFLHSSIGESASIDTTDRKGGSEDWILLKNIDPGANTGVNYIARENQITAALVNAALAGGAALDSRNMLAVTSVSYAENAAGVSIPAFMSRNFLNAAGVETSDGNPVSLEGNRLPNTPEHNFRIGLSNTTADLWGGTVVLRWDYFWQSSAFARFYNTQGDEIDAWGQHNVSASYESLDGAYSLRLWMRNVADKANITGHYLTSDTSGLFRNYFLTEPRIAGLTVRVNFD